MRLGRLTTSVDSGSAASTTGGGGGAAAAPVQPTLVASDIPTLPGRYVDYWSNVALAIRSAEHVRQSAATEVAAVYAAIESTLVVKPAQAAECIKFLCLARKSSLQGRTVRWEEEP